MKKVFLTTMSVIAVAAMMMLVSCKKDNGTDNNKEKEQPETETVDEELVGTWTIIGEYQGWTEDVAMTESNNVWTATNVPVKGEGFKFRKDGSWDINLGAVETRATLTYDDGAEILLEKGAANIAGSKGDGYYDITLNLLKKTATIKFAGEFESPAVAWDYVLDISDYNRNSEFHFKDPIKINPNALTFQWKFRAFEWHDYGKTRTAVVDGEEKTYSVWCNRLGQIGNEDEQGILFRFNDGGEKGQLRLGSAIWGNNDVYLAKDGAAYIWSLDEWHTLTITSDGTTVSVYDNETLITSFNQSTPELFATEWPIERFDISMTWDDGTGYPLGQTFLGYIAYTRVWSKALNAEEIAASLCNVQDTDGLQICWNYNLDGGTTIKNAGAASGYDLDFTKAKAAGRQSYVKAENIEGGWTAVEDIENGTVCAE